MIIGFSSLQHSDQKGPTEWQKEQAAALRLLDQKRKRQRQLRRLRLIRKFTWWLPPRQKRE